MELRFRKLGPEGGKVLWLEELASSQEHKGFFPRDAPDFLAIMGKSPPVMPFDFSLALKIQLFPCKRCIQRLAGFLQACWGFQKLVLSKGRIYF